MTEWRLGYLSVIGVYASFLFVTESGNSLASDGFADFYLVAAGLAGSLTKQPADAGAFVAIFLRLCAFRDNTIAFSSQLDH